jgi:hypothetical protein
MESALAFVAVKEIRTTEVIVSTVRREKDNFTL